MYSPLPLVHTFMTLDSLRLVPFALNTRERILFIEINVALVVETALGQQSFIWPDYRHPDTQKLFYNKTETEPLKITFHYIQLQSCFKISLVPGCK